MSWGQKLDPLLGLLGRLGRTLGNLGLYPAKLAKQIWELHHDSGILVRDPLSVPTCNSRFCRCRRTDEISSTLDHRGYKNYLGTKLLTVGRTHHPISGPE